MERRQLLALLGGAALAWPHAGRAQQTERMRRIGVLFAFAADDAVAQARVAAFLQGLQQAGWEVGRNVRVETVWTGSNSEDVRRRAAELVALAPDVILAGGSAVVGPLLQVTRSVPVVFAIVPDPVGAGYVESLARPGGNATGFTNFEYGIGGKWVELLKQVAPGVRRAGIVRDPAISAGLGLLGAIQAAAPTLGLEVSPIDVRGGREIDRAVAGFARRPDGGLVVTGSAWAVAQRELLIGLAARYKLPAVYFERLFVTAGGLISYGPDYLNQFRSAAGYVDRILKGEKPGELPVQTPTKYELVINLKTAKALGLEISPTVLARADEVIE